MLRQRILVGLVLLPIGVLAIQGGTAWFAGLMALMLGIAGWEYVQLFKTGGFRPNSFLVPAGIVSLIVVRLLGEFRPFEWLLPILIMLSMAAHIWAYEKGRDEAGTDFAITLGGIFYIGLLGSYFIPLRALPDGNWWVFVVLPGVWLVDSGAYFLGSKYGKHKLAPRLSPKKTWEGFFGGILFGMIGIPLLVQWYYSMGLDPNSGISMGQAAIMGVVLGVFPTLGDLGESMIKRQVGVKDSGTLLPGHGGLFDRMDSWLWAAPIGYYVIVWFFI